MKIRIKDNAIRLRLTKSEVAELCDKGCYQSRTVFNDSIFTYELRLDDNLKELSADFTADTITLGLPKVSARDWDTNTQIGFENTQKLPNGSSLQLLVEKDFTCLDTRVEDESDNYPNPKLIQ